MQNADRWAGFTLLELLVVLAVLGVLLALATPSYLRWRDASLLRQAQTLVAAELDRARSEAKRTNSPRSVTWTATSFAGRPLEGGVTIASPPQTVTYVQPYGTLQAVGGTLPAYEITLRRGTRSAPVRVVGVFGKAVVKAVGP